MYKINQSIALSQTDFSDVCMGIIAMLDTTACGGGPVSRNQHTCDSHSHDESLSNKDIEYDIGNIPGHGQSLRNIVKYSYNKHAYNELMLTSTCISKVIFIPLNFKKNIVHLIDTTNNAYDEVKLSVPGTGQHVLLYIMFIFNQILETYFNKLNKNYFQVIDKHMLHEILNLYSKCMYFHINNFICIPYVYLG